MRYLQLLCLLLLHAQQIGAQSNPQIQTSYNSYVSFLTENWNRNGIFSRKTGMARSN